MLVLLVLYAITACYLAVIVYDVFFLRQRYGIGGVRVRLRRGVANALFFDVVLLATLYYEFFVVEVRDGALLFALLLLFVVVSYQGFRQKLWILQKEGMLAAGRFWCYQEIKRLAFVDERVEIEFFTRTKALFLYPIYLQELQMAAEFLYDGGVFQARIKEEEV